MFDAQFEIYDDNFDVKWDGKAAGESLAATLCGAFKAVGDDFAVGVLVNGTYELARLYWQSDTPRHNKGEFAYYRWVIDLDPPLYAHYSNHENDVSYDDEFRSRCITFGGPLMEQVPREQIVVRPRLQTQLAGWRETARAHLAGAGVNNQGNVYYHSRPKILHDELWFRHIEEQYVYDALMRRRIPMMPLPVIMRIDGTKRPNGISGRIEPDFCLLYKGTFVLLEIDGGSHWETPVDADKRLEFLREHGALVRRLPADRCGDPEKAALAVADALASVDREIGTR